MSYSSFILSADRLIKKRGMAMTLLSQSSTYDAATSAAVVSSTSVSAWGIFKDLDERRAAQNQSLGITSEVVMSAIIDAPPKVGDDLLVGSTRYEIVTADLKAPGGEAVIYVLGVRRGA